MKNVFLHKLEQALAAIPTNELYIIVGDFNAIVGSHNDTSDPCSRVRGPYDYGSSNDAGKELLIFSPQLWPLSATLGLKSVMFLSRPGSI